MKPKILFVSEAVSLAHVARPSVLAGALDQNEYDIHFASNGQYPFCYDGHCWTHHSLHGINSPTFLKRLASGQPLYTEAELSHYIKDDLSLIKSVNPDIIVGDFRLSLGISARSANIPLFTITNAHWSPYYSRPTLPSPDLPIARLISHQLFGKLFNMAWPLASYLHVRAANRLRHTYGLSEYASLNEYYCDGDVVMYADYPGLTPASHLPKNHVFIGPIIWSPPVKELPDWWATLADSGRRPIYATLGTTGKADLLPQVVVACRDAGVRCLVATAGRNGLASTPPWIYAAPFLPGSEAAEISSMVICNGGSASAHQALAKGKPVFGICSNLDQLQTMESLTQAGAGEYIRASIACPKTISENIVHMLSNSSYSESAEAMAIGFADWNARNHFRTLINQQFD